MLVDPAKSSPGVVGIRVAGVVAGTLVLLLVLLAIVRPEMMSMATLYEMMSAMGL